MDRPTLFHYDAHADLKMMEVGVETRGAATVHDITFAGAPGQEPIKAYLVVPDGQGSFAGILWVHWLGEDPKTTNRSQYLEEAIKLAPKGAVSLLVDAMWAAPGWYSKRVPEQDYENSINQVISLRRALDLLGSQPNVDKARLGLVGHDYGGMYSIIAAGIEPRARTYVFVAVTSSLSNWAFFAAQPKSKVEYLRQNAVFELTDYLGQIKNASFLFQFSRNDPYISQTDGHVIYNAASKPKELKAYEADHNMIGDAIVADRDAWLVRELALNE